VALVLFVLVWIASTIYLAVALALCVAVLMLVYWAFTQLPARFGGGRTEPPPPRPSERRAPRRRAR
jgi:hypothetical protein